VICLGLGSNLGDRAANLRETVARLAAWPGIKVEKVSSVYETAPVGLTEQPDFLNAVAVVATTLTPAELLAACLEVEKAMGRVRLVRWGPRVIDIDVLLYDDVSLDTPDLVLPHPRLHERSFVLVPLAEVAPVLPVYGGKTAIELLAGLAGCPQGEVRLYGRLD
jgi:2-amino-4-hydroxy-6-hydroxymethyldihydropteridine diphosphokinase